MNKAVSVISLFYWYRRSRKLLQKKGTDQLKKKIRTKWVRPIFVAEKRRAQGFGDNLINEMRLNNDVNHYFNFFRMTPQSFDELLSLIGPHISKVDCKREPITAATRLALTLRYLASGDSMTSLSYSFRMGLSTVSQCISETTATIWSTLQPAVLKCPNAQDWQEIGSTFLERWQFPNCIGAIDGKHIKIQAPPHAGSSFYNYKGDHSIVLLAVADARYTFTLVDIGAAGRQSDGGVFANSLIGQKLKSGQLYLPPPKRISNERPEMPHVIVGDEAFPLLPNLLRPYPGRPELDVERTIYNYRLSRARLVIENAFGILASRWRIFSKPIIAKIENVENIVKAAVCLHNFVMKQKNYGPYFTPDLVDQILPNNSILPGSWRTDESIIFGPLGRLGANNYTRQASDVRETFKEYFNEEGSVHWQWNCL